MIYLALPCNGLHLRIVSPRFKSPFYNIENSGQSQKPRFLPNLANQLKHTDYSGQCWATASPLYRHANLSTLGLPQNVTPAHTPPRRIAGAESPIFNPFLVVV